MAKIIRLRDTYTGAGANWPLLPSVEAELKHLEQVYLVREGRLLSVTYLKYDNGQELWEPTYDTGADCFPVDESDEVIRIEIDEAAASSDPEPDGASDPFLGYPGMLLKQPVYSCN